jgi:putative transposase
MRIVSKLVASRPIATAPRWSRAVAAVVARPLHADGEEQCPCCGRKREGNRVERGLYVCDECGAVANADVNGAENIRQKVSPSPATDGGDRSNGWLAQPSTFLFDKETGAFAPQEQGTS